MRFGLHQTKPSFLVNYLKKDSGTYMRNHSTVIGLVKEKLKQFHNVSFSSDLLDKSSPNLHVDETICFTSEHTRVQCLSQTSCNKVCLKTFMHFGTSGMQGAMKQTLLI